MPRYLFNVFNLLMLIMSISLIQWHSIQFWVTHTGDIGIAWSLTLEMACMWLWWQNRKRVAFVTSLLVIAGPIAFQVLPVIETLDRNNFDVSKHTALLEASHRNIAQLEQALDSYLRNSEERLGWATRIDETQAEIEQARSDQLRLIQASPADIHLSNAFVTVSIQVLAISILFLTQILVIAQFRSLSADRNNVEIPERIEIEEVATEDDFEAEIERVSKWLFSAIQESRKTQAQWAKEHGISAKSISLLKHHQARKIEGKEVISAAELNKIISITT